MSQYTKYVFLSRDKTCLSNFESFLMDIDNSESSQHRIVVYDGETKYAQYGVFYGLEMGFSNVYIEDINFWIEEKDRADFLDVIMVALYDHMEHTVIYNPNRGIEVPLFEAYNGENVLEDTRGISDLPLQELKQHFCYELR